MDHPDAVATHLHPEVITLCKPVMLLPGNEAGEQSGMTRQQIFLSHRTTLRQFAFSSEGYMRPEAPGSDDGLRTRSLSPSNPAVVTEPVLWMLRPRVQERWPDQRLLSACCTGSDVHEPPKSRVGTFVTGITSDGDGVSALPDVVMGGTCP